MDTKTSSITSDQVYYLADAAAKLARFANQNKDNPTWHTGNFINYVARIRVKLWRMKAAIMALPRDDQRILYAVFQDANTSLDKAEAVANTTHLSKVKGII